MRSGEDRIPTVRVLVGTVPVPGAHLCEQEVSRIGLGQMRCVTRTNRRRVLSEREGAAEGREDVRLKSHTITEQNRRPSFPLYFFCVVVVNPRISSRDGMGRRHRPSLGNDVVFGA
jgi:hypothetical protein